MKGKIFLAVAVCLFFIAAVAQAQVSLKVDETATQAVFASGGLQTNLAIENAAQSFTAQVKLEILGADDVVIANSETRQTIKRGRQILQIPIEFNQKEDAENLLWKRLRYTVSPENSPNSVSGIVSLSEIMPEVFELQISAPEKIFAGMNIRAHALALHPFTKKPVKNVEIAGEIEFDLDNDADENGPDEVIIKAKGRTNHDGFATLDFQIPADAKIDDCCSYISINGAKNGILRGAKEELEVSVESFVYLNTDKPIYQPAQKLFVRGLYLNALKRPLAERQIKFEITDEADETIYEGTAKTSRFGVLNIEWKIPENFKLGNYKIEVDGGDGTIGAAEFKVSRYDLPNFTVKTETDKSFYLPEQTAAYITVNANYLFGKPVAQGVVKIVREKERNWNYWGQKYETEEGEIIEGETDAEGKFTARFDLAEAQKDLQNDNWKRFADVKYAAYFTDVSTNRTEQKRFDVRLSKEPIHVYFIRQTADANPKLPFTFYVSTFYADGTPARCDLKIEGNYQGAENGKNLAEAKTNSYGAGVFEIRIPGKPFPEAKNHFDFRILADDRKGNRGSFADNIYVDDDEKQIRVSTDKTIYTPNESIEAKIFSTETERTVFVEVLKDSSVVYSKRVKSGSGGRAAIRIPFQPDFKGELTIAAYLPGERNHYNHVVHSKTIIFPAPNNLNFNLKSLKSVYRPNEDAKITFNVQNGERKPLETALGVVVLDKAIEERARTEQLPDNLNSIRKLIGTADVFGNLTRRDLDNLDLSKPIDADLQLAAEFLLVNKTYEPNFFASDSYQEDFSKIYSNYFLKKLASLDNVLKTHYEKTAEYPKDENSLRQILSANGVNFDQLRDAWDAPFRAEFSAARAFTVLTLKTASADKKFDTDDDFTAKEMRFEWFAKTQNELAKIFKNYLQQSKKMPQTIDEIRNIWQLAGFDFDALRDGWNRPLYLDSVRYNRHTQKVSPETIGNLDGETQQVLRTKIVSQDVILFKVRSAGADGVQGVDDDFDLAAFPVVLSEKDLPDERTQQMQTTISKSRTTNASGAIGGTLFDPTGAVIPGANVTAENQNLTETFSVTSNDSGEFLLANLPSGKYKVSAESPGFQKYTIENVVVSAMNLIKLEIYLNVAGATMTVDVSADSAAIVETSSSAVKSVTKSESKSIADALKQNKNVPNFTPRVRDYFPETLVWSPELVTDKNGKAELKFKLGDNLTTWKLYAVGSTESGEIGLIEKEFQTFQPFFAELDPPRVLTEGDEIALPVPVRNYTEKRQKVAVSLAENDWSRLLSDANQLIEIAPNGSQNAVFNFRAVAPVTGGKQKVSAIAKNDADAIEKNVTVKPNGKEEIRTQSNLFQNETSFEVNFPADAFPATRRTEIKIYPNMLAHVAESVEGLLKRPYGCGEQTTSSTYPNLLILKIEKEFGKPVDPKIKAQAQNYLIEGYKRLLSYQTPVGGFSYWGKSDAPNIALTAYVLRFLNDAKGFIEVDESVIENAQNWLLKQQQTDGSWKLNNSDADVSTAYVARSLALIAGKDETIRKSLRRGLEFLEKRQPDANDSYVLANTALAAAEIGDAVIARKTLEKLRNQVQTENDSSYWKTANTPFYGWGKTAEIETTALVVQAFLKGKKETEERIADDLISKGLLFLLKNKDKFGVWHSTQTTVNVLDTLVLLQKWRMNEARNADEKIEIYVNGTKAREFFVSGEGLKNPFVFDVSSLTNQQNNRIEIKSAGNPNLTMAQIVSLFYVNWKKTENDSRYFDLKVNFDKTGAKIGEEIICSVFVESKNNRRAMILTEIGLPPGADVDRASLEKAKTEEKFSSYDVLPDKIVIYSWTNSAPMNFKFKFRPRFGLNAQTAPSVVYDYYNEQARATIAPLKFLVK